MQLQSTIFAISALAALSNAATWNDQLKLYTIGTVSSTHGWAYQNSPNPVGSRCDNVPEGDYACGSYEEKEVEAFRAIYRCKDGFLELTETCHEGDKYHKNNRCVKNGRRKGKRFYPFVPAEKVVCVNEGKI
jgi:hypothetical protein